MNNQFIQYFKSICFPIILLLILTDTVYGDARTVQELLMKKVTFSAQNENLKTVLGRLEKSTGVRFTYATAVVQNQKITIRAQEIPLEQLLKDALQPLRIDFSVSGDFVILEKQKEDPKTISPQPSQQKIQKTTTNQTITGKVVDEAGETLPGVSILVKGTALGTITDEMGAFSLDIPTANSTLIFSFVGFISQEVSTGNKTSLSITLVSDSKVLEELVVIGYGTSKKKDLTGSISNIKAEDLAAQAPRNVQDILRANAPGLNIGIATDAKAESSLSIRGKGTLTANNNPLIVLNNVIYEGALADINPADIATVDILKDASAAAVYGARSANGVIVITTKKGKKGKPMINFSSNTGIAVSANQPGVLDANGFMKFRQDYNEGRNSEAYLNQYPQMFTSPFELNGVNKLDWYNYDQKTPVTDVSDDQLNKQWLSRLNFTTPEIENYMAGKVTQWDNLVFQKGFQQDYNVSVSNATDYSSQYFSIGYTDRKGVIVGDRYKNLRARINLESKITPFLTVGANTQFATRNEGYLKANWTQMTFISPYGSNNIDDPTSLYRRRPTGLDPINPFYDNLYTERIDRRQNVISTLYSKVQLPFGIEYNLNFSPYYDWSEYYNHHSSQGENWTAIGGTSTRRHNKRFSWQFDNILRWSKEFNKMHRVDVTFLANAENAKTWSTTANASNYSPNDLLGYHALQSGSVVTVISDDTHQSGDALMGRIFYSLKNRYMITTSIRRDGYSAFGKKNPRAFFPSVALGWTFTEENFMPKDGWLNYGKLRLSWGENGNREIGQYAALARMSSSLLPYIDQAGNIYSTSQIYVTSMANYNLKWERTASYNVGIDFELFKSKLAGTIEAYTTRTNDLLVSRALPDITGYKSVMSNLGQIQNNGVELSLNSTIIKTNDFRWTASANFSFNRRKINSLYGDKTNILDSNGQVIGQKDSDDPTNGWFIGQDPDRIWSYKRNGVWQAEEKEQAAKYGLQPGDFKYEDINQDGIMNNDDKVFQGYETPRFRWSLRNEAEYKGFRLSMMMYSNLNYYGQFQRAANNYAFPDRTSDYDFPRWTSRNPINDYARIGSKNIGTNYVNKSFVRIENVTLSYIVPKSILQKLSIQNLQLSASVQNVGVISAKWNFWDPESETITPRTFNFGVNLTL